MSITYNYEIISTDAQARCMEVVYTAEGRKPVHISARLPYVGEQLSDIIAMYSPVAYWKELEAEVVVPALVSGTVEAVAAPVDTLATAKTMKLAQIAMWRYNKETQGILVDGRSIATSREAQAQLAAVYAQLSSGAAISVDWKLADNTWTTLNTAQVSAILVAVTEHVQSCFSAEKELATLVAEATTVEEVNAVTPV